MPENLDALFALSARELDSRLRRVTDRIETRAAEGRDFTQSEIDQNTLELANLRVAIEHRARNDERLAALDSAIGNHRRGVESRSQPTLLVSPANIEQHARALAEGCGYGAVETRSRVTVAADLGSAGAWHPGNPGEPRHLISFAGIPVSKLTGRTAQVPRYGPPLAAAGVDETVEHPEYDDVSPLNLTALRYGRWSEVSALADQVDDLTALSKMHGWAIARDLDRLAVTAVEGAAALLGVAVDLDEAMRQAILTVAAATYTAETQLVIIGAPAALAELTGTTPANGADLGSYAASFGGAKLYPSTAASDSGLTVFAPAAFRVFQSPLQSASLIDPADGSHKFGQWLHSTALAEQIPNSAVTVGAS